MSRIASENDLACLQKNTRKKRNYKKEVIVCGGTGCLSSGNEKILESLQKKIKELGKEEEIRIVKTGCVDFF